MGRRAAAESGVRRAGGVQAAERRSGADTIKAGSNWKTERGAASEKPVAAPNSGGGAEEAAQGGYRAERVKHERRSSVEVDIPWRRCESNLRRRKRAAEGSCCTREPAKHGSSPLPMEDE